MEKLLKKKYEAFLRYDEKAKTMVFDDFSGGMISDVDRFRKNAVRELFGLEPRGFRLVSMGGVQIVEPEGGFAEGVISAHKAADGVLLFRKGRTLYAYREGHFSVVGEKGMLSSDFGEIYDDGTFFYVMDGETIFAVSRDLSVLQTEQKVPVCFQDLSRSGAYFTEIAPQNPFCRYIDVILSDEASNEQRFPSTWAVDPTYARAWHPDGREVYPGYLMRREDRVIFDGDDAAGCRLRLRLLDSEDENIYSFSKTAKFRDILNQPDSVNRISFSAGETVFLLSKDKMLYGLFLSDEGFSDCSEKRFFSFDCRESITGIIGYDEGYLVFFENAVKKLTLEHKAESILFSLSPFQSDFGSDMRGSICCFDDKTVFASSKGGIYCIDRFGISEKLRCRKISANIENGTKGFFSHTEDEYRSAVSACAFGKYFLTVGDVTYIWDYRAKLPSSTQSHADEAEMVWMMGDWKAMRYLCALSGRLYYAERDTDHLCYMERERGKRPFRLTTSELDFGGLKEKILVKLAIDYRCHAEATISLCFDGSADGICYQLPISDDMRRFSIRTYAKHFRTLRLILEGEGDFALDALRFEYFD